MRRVALILAALAVLGSAACSSDKKPATWEPGALGSPAPPAVAPAEDGSSGGGTAKPAFTQNPDGTVNRSGGPIPSTSSTKISAGGLGPYKIGVTLQTLQSAKLVSSVAAAKGCDNYTTAKGVSKYSSLTARSDSTKTHKGVRVGSPLANVKGSYPSGKQLNDWAGGSAWLAMSGDYALLFPVKNDKVALVQAGMAEPVQFKYTDNQGC
jgi:hypothetical protein